MENEKSLFGEKTCNIGDGSCVYVSQRVERYEAEIDDEHSVGDYSSRAKQHRDYRYVIAGVLIFANR